MAIFLNKKILPKEKDIFTSTIKTYSGLFIGDLITRTSSADSPWSSVSFNPTNDFIIAVADTPGGSLNNVMYSTDGGVSWGSYTVGSTSNGWKSITYGNGKFVAVGNGSTNYVMYSTKPNPTLSTDWVLISSAGNGTVNNSWKSIVYGNGYFIAVSSDGTSRLMISKDGINWNAKSILNLAWSTISYSSTLKKFIILSNGGDKGLISNYNGDYWSSFTTPQYSWKSVIWSHKLKIFVAVSNTTSDSFQVMTSIDGINWILRKSASTLSWSSIAWSQELETFFVVSTNGNVMTSKNGIDWFLRDTPNNNSWNSVIWNNYSGSFIAVSSSGTNNRVLSTKELGIGHPLSKLYYYYEYQNKFNYIISKIGSPINTLIKNYSNLDEINDFIYSISPDLPTGITLNPNTGEIYGSHSSIFKKTKYVITATNLKQTLKTNITLTISNISVGLSNFNYGGSDILNEVDSYINIIPNIKGSQPINYTVSPQLPDGITIDPISGIISGKTPSSYSVTTHVVTATNSINSVTTSLKIIINDLAPESFTYGANLINLVSQSISYSPSKTNSKNLVYSISYVNVSGILSINSSTGVITGTLPSTSQNINVTVSATNSGGTIFTNFVINVKDTEITSFSYSNNNLLFFINETISIGSPTISGTGIRYKITPELPTGLTFNTENGSINGKISNVSSDITYTVNASNSSGSVNTTLRIRVIYLTSTITNGNQFYPNINVSVRDYWYNNTNIDLSGSRRNVNYRYSGYSLNDFSIRFRTLSYYGMPLRPKIGSISNSGSIFKVICVMNYDQYDGWDQNTSGNYYLGPYLSSGFLIAFLGNEQELKWSKITIGSSVLLKSNSLNSFGSIADNDYYNFNVGEFSIVTYWEWVGQEYRGLMPWGSSVTRNLFIE
jgi:hypothetical protein